MPGARKDPNTLRTTPLGKWLVSELGTTLATTRPVVPTSESDLVGTLLYAAMRSPLEAVKANLSAYRDYEADCAPGLAAAEAVCAFLRSHG